MIERSVVWMVMLVVLSHRIKHLLQFYFVTLVASLPVLAVKN